VGSKGL
jgi:Arabinose efflux permease